LNDGDIPTLERMRTENPSEEGYDGLIRALKGSGELAVWVEDLDNPTLNFDPRG